MLDLLSAAPKQVQFGKRILLVGALKLRELGYLQRFIRDNTVRPTVAVKARLEFYPVEKHAEMLEAADREDTSWPPELGTVEGNTVILGTEAGQRYFLSIMLRKYQPDLDDAFLEEVMGGIGPDDFSILVSVAFGEDDLDPEELRRQRLARLAALKARLAAEEAEIENAETPGGSESSTTTSSAETLL